ncbi:MAG: hypothetical protein H7A31_02805 [Thermotogae bacterium]|jgi:hypothetical protein|nr:hypothetical protein [Thermotogota bacterium]MCP5465604.1 hypothetical protein [Thermotogota bacterium]HOO74154.1 hypothetical protein [Tepiditoga sp.]
MKKIYIVFTVIFFSVCIFSQSNFNIGGTILTDTGWHMAVKLGAGDENFDLSMDISPLSVTPLSLITVTDFSVNLAKAFENTYLNTGILWLNDRPFPDADSNRSILFVYGGLNYGNNNFYGKLSFGYPLSSETLTTFDLTDYLFIKIGYNLPKPTNFKDELKIEFRFARGRKDISVYFSEPIG